MTSEPESINNYVSVSATQCLPPSSFPPPKNGSQIISPPDLACGSFLSDNHVETIDFKNETPPELSIIGTIHNESNKQVEFALNEDRNVCDYESSPGTSPVDNHIMQYPVNIQFNETNHNQKNSPQEQKINENLPHSDKTSSIINETTTNIKNSNNNSGNNSNNNGKGCTQDNEKINGEGNQAHDHLSDSPLLDPIYSNDISTQEINNIEDAKILDEMRYNIGIDSIDFSDVSNQILQGVKFNPFILRYPSLFIEAPNIINENDKNGKNFLAKKRKKKSFEFSSAHLSTNNSRSNFKSINFGVDQYVTSPIEKSISVIDPLRIPKEQNMERKNLPYLLSALTILEPLNFSQEEIEKLSHVNTQRFPESSELFLDPDGIILAASFNQLIIFLTHPQASSLDFQQQFLISFPSFTSPTKVLAAIIMRFFANVNYSGCNIANEKELKLIRYRITRIISKWLSLTKYQFTEQMIYAIDIFCQVITTENGLQAQERIIEIAIMSFKGMNNNVTTLTYKSGTPSSCLPHGDASKWKLTKIPPIETARQITLLHSQIFRSIKPTEILAVIWGDKKSGGSPNITKLIQHFNAFSNVVMLTVLFPKKSKKRALVHAHWVAVAYHCYEIHNFHAMFSIVFGLTHPSIERLSKTVARSAKICGKKFVFSNMKELCKFDNDYHNYREMIANTMEPCVPFIGCIQKDLIYVQESFQNTIYDLINFKKCIECVSLLQKITRFQNERYNFELSEKIQTLITNIPLETDNVILMKLSMSREVRNMKK